MIGNDVVIVWGGVNGVFEFNVYILMMVCNIFEFFKLLINVLWLFV